MKKEGFRCEAGQVTGLEIQYRIIDFIDIHIVVLLFVTKPLMIPFFFSVHFPEVPQDLTPGVAPLHTDISKSFDD